jgi:peptide chain release factor subunit 1
MAEIDRAFLRTLAEWRADGAPVSSVYLDVDGRRYPKKEEVVRRARSLTDDLLRQAQDHHLSKDATCSVSKDVQRMVEHVEGVERDSTRGLAMFACSSSDLWEAVEVPRPVPDRAGLADHAYVVPLEALVETYQSFCTALVDRSRARILLAKMGRIEERTDILDDVPGRHEQGGWSQSRYQRHIEEHAVEHLKHVADRLLGFWKVRRFDHLILAGPHEVVVEFERNLHDYLSRRIVDRIPLSMTASPADVLARSLEVEERVEAARERELVDRIRAEAAAGRHGVVGLEAVLASLNDGRVEALAVPFGLEREGVRCTTCGRLWMAGARCPTCRGRTERVPDVVDEAVASAIRQSARVDVLTLVSDDPRRLREVEAGALLRY